VFTFEQTITIFSVGCSVAETMGLPGVLKYNIFTFNGEHF
jgi:hypothetical protein